MCLSKAFTFILCGNRLGHFNVGRKRSLTRRGCRGVRGGMLLGHTGGETVRLLRSVSHARSTLEGGLGTKRCPRGTVDKTVRCIESFKCLSSTECTRGFIVDHGSDGDGQRVGTLLSRGKISSSLVYLTFRRYCDRSSRRRTVQEVLQGGGISPREVRRRRCRGVLKCLTQGKFHCRIVHRIVSSCSGRDG